METKNIDELNGNKKNPRTISKEDFEALKKSIQEFGDISGVIFNTQTKQLVGGHQRIEAFKALPSEKKIIITQRFDPPTKTGTLAIGYVTYNNETYAYREVDWDQGREHAANIAANRIGGQFDLDLLAQINYELSQLENGQELLALSGQTEKELERLNKMIGVVENDPEQPDDDNEKTERLEFSLTAEQREVVEEALGNIKATKDLLTNENASLNGAALYWLSRDWLDRLHGLKDDSNNAPIKE